MGKRLICLCLVLLLIPGAQVRGTTLGELQQEIGALEEEKEKLDNRLQELEKQLIAHQESVSEMVAAKNVLDEQIFLLNESLALTREQLASQAEKIANTQEQLDLAQEELATLRTAYRERIRAMEENGTLSYWAVLFEANSFSDLLDRIAMIEEINRADRKCIEQLRTATQEVAQVKEALMREKSLLEMTRQEQEQTADQLASKRMQADALLRKLVEAGLDFEKLLHEAEMKQQQLMEELAQKENQYAQMQEATKPITPGGSQGGLTDGTVWLTPVPYYTLSSVFGNRFHPILNIWRMHNGIDMACAEGTEIYASRSGVVTVAAYQKDGAGNYVQIDHGDGYRSIYMHMTHYIVKPGQRVEAGQVIGYVGSTGLSKGNHLHFGISYNGVYVNPLEYL